MADQKWRDFMREQFPPGARVRLRAMNDPLAPVPPGTEGTVDFIDDECQLHMKWDNGRSLALIPGVDKFTVIQPEPAVLKLYMPLTAQLYERGEYGDLEDEPSFLDGRELTAYHDSILAGILRERMPEEKERGLMTYYHDDDGVNQKVKSYVFTVEEHHGKLWGVAECEVYGALTGEEMAALRENISGQASDGAGEGFEQRPIKTAGGELYVSLWSSDKSWRVMTEDEMYQSQRMGGMRLEGSF